MLHSLHNLKINHFFVIVTFALFFSSVLKANANLVQEAPQIDSSDLIKFQQITMDDNLSSNSVYDVVQDKNGFIWIATADGLNRYDGDKVVHYRHSTFNKQSIANNQVRKVFVDSKGVLWVGTANGLSRYIPNSDNFENYSHIKHSSFSLKDNVIWDIYEDKKNILWVSTETGLHKFNSDQDRFESVRFKNFDDKIKEIKTIHQDDNNNYWFGTYENGIFITSADFSHTFSLSEPNKWRLNIQVNGLYDFKKINTDYWLATDAGLIVINKDYELINHYTEANSELLDNHVRSIEQLNDAMVLVGTFSGLNIINKFDGTIKAVVSGPSVNSLSENWIMDIFKDRSGGLWLATNGGGLNKLSQFSFVFTQRFTNKNGINHINSIAQTQNKMWFSSDQLGIFSYSDADNLPLSYTALSVNDTIMQILSNNSDNLWLRTADSKLYQLSTINFALKELENWHRDSNKGRIMIDNNIWYLSDDGNLKSFNVETQDTINHSIDSGYEFTSIGKDEDSGFTLTTTSGLLINYIIDTATYREQNVATDARFDLSQTSNLLVTKDWIWLGSQSQGVALVNRKSQKLEVFNEENGLPNNQTSDIFIDDYNTAWLTSLQNIVNINPETKLVRSFGSSHAISQLEFLSFSSLKSTSGEILFGSSNGIIQFNPSDLLDLKMDLFSPVLTNLLIANKKIGIVKLQENININKKLGFKLEHQLNYLNRLTLKYNQSPFSIEFSLPNAKFKDRIKYSYRLLELEENWIDSNSDNLSATYTNLSPGNYIFEVQVYDKQKPEITKVKRLPITILPPWWLSSGAIFLYSFVVLALFTYFLRQIFQKRSYHLQIKQSEERLKLSLWGSGDEMWDWNIKTGKIYRSNIWGILEFPQDGKRNVGTDQTNIHQQDIPRVRQALADHFDGKTEHFESTYRVKNKNDQWIWILDRGKVVDRNDKAEPTRMTGTLKDISQIKKAEESLKLFAKCIENISDAVVIYNRQFNVVDVNKAFQRITLKSRESMLGTPLNFSRYPESFTQNVKKHLLNNGSWHGEIESFRANKQPYLTDINIDIIRDENGNISHFVGVFSDITKRKETEAELRKLASSDTLTGLPNRSYFQANQNRLVRNKVPHALLVFDLDNFKKINDSMGHEVGDVLLVKVAERILNIGRQQDSVYRLGGDEFSIIIENTNDIHTITSIAKDILKTIGQPLKLKSQEIVLYSSIGIVLYPEDGATPQELLKNADTAMYHAKDLGGNKYQFFNESMNKQAVKRLQIESLIRHGLKEDCFSVFYQPKIEISSGKIAGMEALVRFETKNKGVISPLQFIPVSEETGQIIDIGEVVLRKACFATKRWVDAGLFDGRLAVNLSAIQFRQPNLVGMIAEVLKESQLPAKYLELEITEGTVMDSPQKAIETMHQIREMGIHLSLDDFGTGYSSLAYLKKFPLNTLKIDKAFVDDIEHSEQGRNMVATIVTIAHNLDLKVVAEGVENNHQLNFLAGLRCEQLQGYLYSKPIPAEDFKTYLVAHQITDRSTSFKI